jgi:hypothetical protein
MAVVSECWVGCRGGQARARWEIGESQVKGDDRGRGRSTSFAPALNKRFVAYLTTKHATYLLWLETPV